MSNGYETLGKLASGGAATVFLARSARGTAPVVLKRPHAHLLDNPGFLASFEREARIAQRIKHPNVVCVRELLTDAQGPALVLDYIDGATLSDLLRHWLRTAQEHTTGAAVRIIIDAARGLHAAHELNDDEGMALGLVHRDMSPQNVLVSRAGVALVTDFGLAKRLQEDERSTTEGVLKGKAGYLAPEYIHGHPLDRRVDVFALGIVGFEVLARKRLFRGENEADSIQRILSMPIPSIGPAADRAEACTAALDKVLGRALAREPAERYDSALAFAQALEAVATHHGCLGTDKDVARTFGPELVRELDARVAPFTAVAAASVPPAAPASLPAAKGSGSSTPRLALGAGLLVTSAAVVFGVVLALRPGFRAGVATEGATTTVSALPPATPTPAIAAPSLSSASATPMPVVLSASEKASASTLAPSAGTGPKGRPAPPTHGRPPRPNPY